MSTPKAGMPKLGQLRFLTRRESELTGFTRATVVENLKINKTEGRIAFYKFGEPVVKRAATASKILTKFWA